MHHKKLAILLLAATAAGCSYDAYRSSADLQVGKILANREQTTLGYRPQVKVAPDAAPHAPAKAYAEIPVTPVRPPTTSPVEKVAVEVPYGPLGPVHRWEQDLDAPDELPDLGVEAAQRQAAARLRLGPPAPNETAVRLDLFKSLEFAVQHSRPYQDQMEQLYLAALDVTLQRHLFEPIPFVTTGLQYQGGQSAFARAALANPQGVAYRSALLATTTAGVSQKLPYGGQITASALVGFVDVLNHQSTDGETAQLALAGSIPLLRGAGLSNLEPLVSSERGLVYSIRGFDDYRRAFAVNVASQYFKLLTQQQAVSNRRSSYKNLSDLTEQTRALYAAGRVIYLEVQRSLQAELQAQSSLITAQASYEAAVDQFKISLGMSVEQNVEIVPVELDVRAPDIQPDDAVSIAKKYRLDLQTARDQVADAHRQVDFAKNGLLPDLNISGGSSVGNLAGSPAKELDSRSLAYEAGITLGLPIDRLAERNTYRASLIGLDEARRNEQNVSEQLTSDVRDAIRQIHSNTLQVRINRRGVELATRRLEYSNDLLQMGSAGGSTRDAVEAQSSLDTARDSYESAKSSYQISVLQLLRVMGVLRVDPEGGSIGHVLDRGQAMQNAGFEFGSRSAQDVGALPS